MSCVAGFLTAVGLHWVWSGLLPVTHEEEENPMKP